MEIRTSQFSLLDEGELSIDSNGDVKVVSVPHANIDLAMSWDTIGRDLLPPRTTNCRFELGAMSWGEERPGPGTLFHYTDLRSARSILESRKLRLSAFSSANDDLERGHHRFDLYCSDKSIPGSAIEISRQFSEQLRKRWRFVSFTNDGSSWAGDPHIPISQSTGWGQPSMWSHYGKRHARDELPQVGAIIAFSRPALIANAVTAFPAGAMIYGDVRYAEPEPYDRAMTEASRIDLDAWNALGATRYGGGWFQHHWGDFYLTKFSGWAHEKEARLLMNDRFDDGAEIPLEGAILEVMVGDGISTESLQEVRALARNVNCLTSIVRWRNGFPRRLPSEN